MSLERDETALYRLSRVFCLSFISHITSTVSSLSRDISFAKEPYKRDYILQKRPLILRSLPSEPPHRTVSSLSSDITSTQDTVSLSYLTSHRLYRLSQTARPCESNKIFKGRPRRNAFSKLVHRQYKSFPPHRFCQVEIKKTTGLSNKHRTA